ncbi:M24 family metallopeptidase [Candidatus Gottesmanbacteria bacterium]|nr:M24 family metallopeptidase [Candidatus Gottesmanbacteria bacterium]
MNLRYESLQAVESLQGKCVTSYQEMLAVLKEGMSEAEINHILINILQKKDIRSYWYEIGVMVLINERRFHDMQTKDYTLKSPSETVILKRGNTIFIDFHPMDENGIWADFSSMCIYKPSEDDQEKVSYLELVYTIHMEGIRKLNSTLTFADVFKYYQEIYKEHDMEIEDVRHTVGHTLDTGSKYDNKNNDKREFLDIENHELISDLILAIEPGGYKYNKRNKMLVGRYEDCVYIPQSGIPIILGRKNKLPFYIN